MSGRRRSRRHLAPSPTPLAVVLACARRFAQRVNQRHGRDGQVRRHLRLELRRDGAAHDNIQQYAVELPLTVDQRKQTGAKSTLLGTDGKKSAMRGMGTLLPSSRPSFHLCTTDPLYLSGTGQRSYGRRLSVGSSWDFRCCIHRNHHDTSPSYAADVRGYAGRHHRRHVVTAPRGLSSPSRGWSRGRGWSKVVEHPAHYSTGRGATGLRAEASLFLLHYLH